MLELGILGITAKQLKKEIGDKNKVHYALKYLQRELKVKKVRGLGIDRIYSNRTLSKIQVEYGMFKKYKMRTAISK